MAGIQRKILVNLASIPARTEFPVDRHGKSREKTDCPMACLVASRSIRFSGRRSLSARVRCLAIAICAGASLMAQQVEFAAMEQGAGHEPAEDVAFLDEIQRRAVLYFMEQSDPVTALTHDRALADGGA
jgi:hypothetical protein